MNFQMRWVGVNELDRVALTRSRCYGAAVKDVPRFAEQIKTDGRTQGGDYLLAEQDGYAVGTATHVPLAMWVRGGRVPCQGVAWVGTIKTHRRGTSGAGTGIASQIMREMIRAGRERQDVVSALMPFRGSFYEHFGYGIVERMSTWTIPLAVLPAGSFDGARFYEAADFSQLAACRQQRVEQGQCDIERSGGSWEIYLKKWEEGHLVIDRLADGSIGGYLAFQHSHKDEKDYVNVAEAVYGDTAGLLRLMHFLGSLRDQYTFATLTLPADLPLNLLLRESQIPHRLVNHPHAEVRPFTRMQVRILDHKRLIEAMHFPVGRSGKTVVAVRETEGTISRFAIDYSAGQAAVSSSETSAEFECSDKTWAAVVCGDLRAGVAVKLGLATASSNQVIDAMDIFAEGDVPFCQEYF